MTTPARTKRPSIWLAVVLLIIAGAAVALAVTSSLI